MTSGDPRERLARLQAVCDAIAHPARRQILLTIHLRGGAVSAGAIAQRFAHAWPTTTRHLRVLTDAGLLVQHAVGRERRYALAPGGFDVLGEWLAWFEIATLHRERPARREAEAAAGTLPAPNKGRARAARGATRRAGR